jgi:negative regulator of sigma E activity
LIVRKKMEEDGGKIPGRTWNEKSQGGKWHHSIFKKCVWLSVYVSVGMSACVCASVCMCVFLKINNKNYKWIKHRITPLRNGEVIWKQSDWVSEKQSGYITLK